MDHNLLRIVKLGKENGNMALFRDARVKLL